MITLCEPPGSYQQLCELLHLNSGVPYSEHWSAAADFLKLLVDEVIIQGPQSIVECGSGVSTLMLAAACRENGGGSVASLEHQHEYASDMRDVIAAYELQEFAKIIDAPLVDTHLNDRAYQWYSLEKMDQHSIDMLVIDGPPGKLQRHSRYPALPLFYQCFAKGATILLDDAARADEQEIARSWQSEFKNLNGNFIDNERGCFRLVYGQ